MKVYKKIYKIRIKNQYNKKKNNFHEESPDQQDQQRVVCEFQMKTKPHPPTTFKTTDTMTKNTKKNTQSFNAKITPQKFLLKSPFHLLHLQTKMKENKRKKFIVKPKK